MTTINIHLTSTIVLILFSATVISSQAYSLEKSCRADIVETIPDGLIYPNYTGPKFNSTISTFLDLVENSQQTIYIASYYWTLLCSDVLHPIRESCKVGEAFVKSLTDALARGVAVKIAVNGNASASQSNRDLALLRSAGAEIASVDFDRLVGAGILHTKFIIADNTSFYLGSSNMDWRSLTQVKEVGVYVRDCVDLARDLWKVWNVYWILGQNGSAIPSRWPSFLETEYNMENPMKLDLNGSTSSASAKVYLTSAPKAFNPDGRTNDIDAVLAAINGAKKFVNIAVMDYSPTFLYTRPTKFWPVIDEALRRAVIERGVAVKLLASNWTYTKFTSVLFLKSLDSLSQYPGRGSLSVKLFNVPSTQAQQQVDHSRVNHNKFMVTDQLVFIGTSNWSADYFVNTGGASLIASFEEVEGVRNLRKDILDIFYRDWESPYSFYVGKYYKKRKTN